MKNIDYYVLSKDYVLAKVENRPWERHKLQDYYPENIPRKYPIGSFDIFDEGELFINTINKVIKSTNRSFLKRIKHNNLVVYVVDELNSLLRKRLFLDGFSHSYRGRSYLCEIGPSTVRAMSEEGYKKHFIVAAVIGNIIELSFCFGGARILLHVVEKDFWTEFNMFLDKASEYQNKRLEECMELGHLEESKKEELLQLWQSKGKFEYIFVSNNDPEDCALDSRFQPDYTMNYTDVATFFGTVFKDINGVFKKQNK